MKNIYQHRTFWYCNTLSEIKVYLNKKDLKASERWQADWLKHDRIFFHLSMILRIGNSRGKKECVHVDTSARGEQVMSQGV